MRLIRIAALATVTVASSSLMAQASPAQAPDVAEALRKVQSGEVATSYAQYRDRYYWGGRDYYGRPYGYDRYGYARPYGYGRYAYGQPYGYYDRPYRYYRRDRGAAAAAGIAGLAAGALIGGALSSQQAQAAPVYGARTQSEVAYCSRRFRSYDPASGTYLGYDGKRHACP